MQEAKTSSFPTIRELSLIAELEDRFNMPDRMDELLIKWHHDRMLPLSKVADIWGVEEEFLRTTMMRYGVQEQEIVEVAKTSLKPFSGYGDGIITSMISDAYQHSFQWFKALRELQQHFPRLTIESLRKWVSEHRANFSIIGSQAVTSLLTLGSSEDNISAPTIVDVEIPATSPVRAEVKSVDLDQNGFIKDTSNPNSFVHEPTGLLISIEVKKAIDQACIEKGCTLAELCREPHYWPLMLCNMSDEVYGISKGIYEVFIKFYRGTLGRLAGDGEHTTDKEDVLPSLGRQTAGLDEVQHPSGITLTPESQDSLKRYCLDLDCTMEELFTDLFDPAKIADTANEIGIGASVYLKLWQYYTAQAKPKAATTGG